MTVKRSSSLWSALTGSGRPISSRLRSPKRCVAAGSPHCPAANSPPKERQADVSATTTTSRCSVSRSSCLSRQDIDNARFEPLVFKMAVGETPPLTLVLHDIAGEAFGDHRRRAQAATFLRAARAIIFLVDPRDIDDVQPSAASVGYGEQRDLL